MIVHTKLSKIILNIWECYKYIKSERKNMFYKFFLSTRIVAKFKRLWKKRYASIHTGIDSKNSYITGVAALNRQKIRLVLTLYYKQANSLNESINGLYN